jgi:hypothetical protein
MVSPFGIEVCVDVANIGIGVCVDIANAGVNVPASTVGDGAGPQPINISVRTVTRRIELITSLIVSSI